jgi:hypothetical protein
MKKRQQIEATIVLLLGIVFATRLLGADPTTAGMRFLKAPKPPFPNGLVREVAATRNMKYNAIVKITIVTEKSLVSFPAEVMKRYPNIWPILFSYQ